MVATREERCAKKRQRLSPKTHPTLARQPRVYVPVLQALAAQAVAADDAAGMAHDPKDI